MRRTTLGILALFVSPCRQGCVDP